MADTKLTISPDDAAIERAAKEASEKYSETFEKAAEDIKRIYQEVFGEDLVKTAGKGGEEAAEALNKKLEENLKDKSEATGKSSGKAFGSNFQKSATTTIEATKFDFGKSVDKGLADLVKSSQFKGRIEEISEKLAGAAQKAHGVKVAPKDITKVLTGTISEAETVKRKEQEEEQRRAQEQARVQAQAQAAPAGRWATAKAFFQRVFGRRKGAAAGGGGAGGGGAGGGGAGGGGAGGTPPTTPGTPDPEDPGFVRRMLWGKQAPQAHLNNLRQFSTQAGTVLLEGLLRPLGLNNAPQLFEKGGLLGGTAMMGAQMLASGFNRVVNFGREQENLMLQAAPLMGGGRAGIQAAQRGLDVGQRAGYTDKETIQYMLPGARAGVLGAGVQSGVLGSILRSQRAYGMGADVMSLFGAQAQKGMRFEGAEGAQRSKQDIQRLIATGMATGLQQGRWGEVSRGLAQMITQRGIGQNIDIREATRGMARISGAFKGSAAIQALESMENLARAPGTAFGRAAALQTAGLGGRAGANIYAAEARMEQGFFGAQTTPAWARPGAAQVGPQRPGDEMTGVQGIQNLLSRYKEGFGFGGQERVARPMEGEEALRRDAMIKTLAQTMGTSATATQQLLEAVESGEGSQEKLKEIVEKGQPLEKQAYRAMIDMAVFKGLESKIDQALNAWWRTILPILKPVFKNIETLLDVVRRLAVTVDDYLKGGIFGRGEREREAEGEETSKRAKEKMAELEKQYGKDIIQQTLEKYQASLVQAGKEVTGAQPERKQAAEKLGLTFSRIEQGGPELEREILQRQVMAKYMRLAGEAPEAGPQGLQGPIRALKQQQFITQQQYEATAATGGLTTEFVDRHMADIQRILEATAGQQIKANEREQKQTRQALSDAVVRDRAMTASTIATAPIGPTGVPAATGAATSLIQ